MNVDDKNGARALIAGNCALLLTMLLHPTAAQLPTLAVLNALVHTLAVLATPLLFLGGIALTRRLGAPAALAFFALSLVAGACAGTISGFVAPDVFRRMSAESLGGPWHALFRYSGIVNQAFARVLVISGAIAIVLWCVSMTARRALRVYGIATNAVIALLVIAGVLPLDVHGYGAVVLLQAIWFFLAARMLLEQPVS